MTINRVGIIGSGLMGSGIAQVCAEGGCDVTLIDVDEKLLAKAQTSIAGFIRRKVEKAESTPEQAEGAIARISTSTSMKDLHSADLVIEAVPERIDTKQMVLRELDAVLNSAAIIASNTSGLSIAALGAATARPSQVVGLHFFYPAPKMRLVEVIPSLLTSQAVTASVSAFAVRIGKTPVVCTDSPGFLVNRLLDPLMNEAAFLVMEGNAPDAVDRAMTLGANHPMGPLSLADFVGVDILLATMEGLHRGFDDPKYRPCPLLKRMVEAGRLGRKTGRGFFSYDSTGKRVD